MANKTPDTPEKWEVPDYGFKNQWSSNESDKTILPPEYIIFIYKVVGKFLYYAREVEPNMLVT